MEIIKTTLEDVERLVSEVLKNQKETAVYCVADDYCAVIGNNGGSDLNAIKQNEIRLVQINHEGGTIVLSPGDVDVGIFTKGYKGHEYRDEIVQKLLALIKEHCEDVYLSGNDILVNEKKVVGFGSRMFGDILYTAIHIAIGMNIDLIKAICTKPMIKEPIGLNTYGIVTDDVLNIIFDVLNDKD